MFWYAITFNSDLADWNVSHGRSFIWCSKVPKASMLMCLPGISRKAQNLLVCLVKPAVWIKICVRGVPDSQAMQIRATCLDLVAQYICIQSPEVSMCHWCVDYPSAAPSASSMPSLVPTLSLQPSAECPDGRSFEMTLITDFYVSESWWEIVQDGNVVSEGDSYPADHVVTTCIVRGCLIVDSLYTFSIYDRCEYSLWKPSRWHHLENSCKIGWFDSKRELAGAGAPSIKSINIKLVTLLLLLIQYSKRRLTRWIIEWKIWTVMLRPNIIPLFDGWMRLNITVLIVHLNIVDCCLLPRRAVRSAMVQHTVSPGKNAADITPDYVNTTYSTCASTKSSGILGHPPPWNSFTSALYVVDVP
jgi:hypothetical protein